MNEIWWKDSALDPVFGFVPNLHIAIEHVDMKTIRTLIIDDEQSSIELLETLLSDYCPHIELIAQAQSVKEGIEQIQELKPELFLFSIVIHL